MKDFDSTEMLEQLSSEYSQKIIGQEEYRIRRKQILDELDRDINNVVIVDIDTDSDTGSLFSRAIAFFKTETHKN